MVRGSDTEFVFNELDSFSGQALVEEGRAGRYRVVIDADGGWTLKFAQSLAPVTTMPGTVSGRGKRVVPVRVARHLQPVVTARHAGRENFIVHVVGYGRQKGYVDFVFNELGSFRGQTLIDDLLAGTYYLAVDADGAWTIRLTP